MNHSQEPQIDYHARRRMAALARRFASGSITNRQFENEIPRSEDPAIYVVENQFWFAYDDFKTHKLIGDHRLTDAGRKFATKLILFLMSDLPYEWPEHCSPEKYVKPSRIRQRLISIGLSCRWQQRATRYLNSGDHEAWPFIRMESLASVVRHPRLLSGRDHQGAP